jgi:PiT family inorganic phosphate transporter
MNIDIIVLTIASLIGLYMAANIGANDLANAMGTSVGSRALTLKQAVLVSIIANVLGAVLAGGHVTSTISKGIIDPGLLAAEPNRLMLGMFAALTAASLWVHLATHFGLPVSTTHAIVGAVVGFGIISVGGAAVSWGKIITIAVSWVISPAVGALFAGSIFYLTEKKVMHAKDPHAAAVHYAPAVIFVVILVLILSFVFKGLKNLHLEIGFIPTLLLAIPCAALASLFGRKWVRWQVHLKCELRPNPQGHSPVECFFAQLQILTACYVAFAHGANDVANWVVLPWAGVFLPLVRASWKPLEKT